MPDRMGGQEQTEPDEYSWSMEGLDPSSAPCIFSENTATQDAGVCSDASVCAARLESLYPSLLCRSLAHSGAIWLVFSPSLPLSVLSLRLPSLSLIFILPTRTRPSLQALSPPPCSSLLVLPARLHFGRALSPSVLKGWLGRSCGAKAASLRAERSPTHRDHQAFFFCCSGKSPRVHGGRP
eukprot:718677-Rhodomonas_salina.7